MYDFVGEAIQVMIGNSLEQGHRKSSRIVLSQYTVLLVIAICSGIDAEYRRTSRAHPPRVTPSCLSVRPAGTHGRLRAGLRLGSQR